jgi:hypothetical protein
MDRARLYPGGGKGVAAGPSHLFGEIKPLRATCPGKGLIGEAVVSSLLSPRLKLPIKTPAGSAD